MKSYVTIILCWLCHFVIGSQQEEVNYKDRFHDDALCDLQWKEIRTNYDKYFQSEW